MTTKTNGHTSRVHGHGRGQRHHAEARPRRHPPAPERALPKTSAPAESSLRRSSFPPIADYAFLSDCEVNALIAPNGNLEWLCVPRHDSPSVFAAMLDRNAGSFRLGVVGTEVPVRREYVTGSLVLETHWQT